MRDSFVTHTPRLKAASGEECEMEEEDGERSLAYVWMQ